MNKKINWKKWVLFALLLFMINVGTEKQVSAAPAKEVCKVYFTNSQGQISTPVLKSWCKAVRKGITITLPNASKPGYRSYWVVKTPAGEKRYYMGATYTVNSDVKFHLYRYKLRTITFYNKYGTGEYTAFRKTLCDGQYLRLPEPPNYATMRSMGWSQKPRSSKADYESNRGIRVSGDMKFYAVYTPVARTIYLCEEDGTLYDTISLMKNETAVFPHVDTRDGNTMQGWSTQMGTRANPQYLPEAKIPEGPNRFYMVVSHKDEERVLAFNELLTPKKYGHVYFVGDSRTYYAMKSFGGNPDGVTMIGKPGGGLNWLKGEDYRFPDGGYKNLIQELNKNKHLLQPGEKSAVVFNLGVNDLQHIDEYIAYMKGIGRYLTKKWNCDLYYESVNPMNVAMYRNYMENTHGITNITRSTLKIIDFNKRIRLGLSENYKYIDTFSMLKRTGWCSDNPGRIADGLHYSKGTYQKIYNYCMRIVELSY